MTQHFHGPVGQAAAGNIYNVSRDDISILNTDVLAARLEVAMAERLYAQTGRWYAWQTLAMVVGVVASIALIALLAVRIVTGEPFLTIVVCLAPAFIGRYLFMRHLRANDAELADTGRRIAALQTELARRVR